MNAPVILETRQLDVSIAGKTLCQNLTLQLRAGECWAVLGGNGAGKTTLLRTLAGLHAADAGAVLLNGLSLTTLPPRTIAQHIGFLLQDYEDIFGGNVLQTALMGRHPWLRPWQWETSQDTQRARVALQTVDLAEFESRDLRTLSGGERRRAHLATLLTQDPPLLLLDEPGNHLDLRHQVMIFEELKKRASLGHAIVTTLHDINTAARYCDRALLLFENGITLHGTAREIITEANMSRLFKHPVRRMTSVEGEVFLPD